MRGRAITASAPDRGPAEARLGRPGDAREREAGRLAAQALEGRGGSAGTRRPLAARPGWLAGRNSVIAPEPERRARGLAPLEGGGEPLPARWREEFEPAFGHEFGELRVHAGPGAVAATRALGARAYASGTHLVFGPGEWPVSSWTGRALLAHELAHVVAEARAGGGADLLLQPTDFGSIPEAERRTLHVRTIPIKVPPERVRDFFTIMPSGRPSATESVGAVNRFGAGIPAALEVGLGSVGAWLAGGSNALVLNSTIEVDLDLSAHGGALSTYRFTYFEHHPRGAAAQSVMLVELVGAAAAAPAPVTVPAGTFTVGGQNFTAGTGWSEERFALLRQALGLLPPAALTEAAGLTFHQRGTGTGGEAGRYLSASDAIEIHGNAFPADTSLRVGGLLPPVRAILHEVGHALDLRVLNRAWQAFDAAGQTPAARRTLLAARSLSGSRYAAPATPGGNYTETQAMDDASPAFRAAVRRDGVRRDTSGRATPEGSTAELSGGPTTYADTDYQELFAEAYALYVTEPETLRRIRPATFAFFAARYPRTP